MNNLLDNIKDVKEIKEFSNEELIQLSNEIRQFILESVSSTGGHLASNLGTIELTVALHYVFNSPYDQLLWDVGHQAYTHKILTGRKDQFGTLRQLDGISGFLKRSESEHDILEAGHSSTSISVALGLSLANKKLGKDNYVLPIIGDGALNSGLAYEAFNYAGQFKSNLIIILNDNEMSISNNVGNISKYLSRLRILKPYTKTKKFMFNKLSKSKSGSKVYKVLSKTKNSIKELFIPGMLFEHFGLNYIGPVDGHNIAELLKTFKIAKKMDSPVLVHVHTIKGKGYRRAELAPNRYHGVGKFDIEKGLKLKNNPTFSSVFGNHLMKIAKNNSKIIAITAAMTTGTGLDIFEKNLKNQFIDVGIAEQNAVTMAVGLALGGFKPYVVIYSTFLQRAFDQIIHDVALQNLDITFCIDRSGLVGRDGETHQGIYDTAYLSLIPNITIITPKDTNELIRMIDFSVDFKGPLAIKYFREDAFLINENINDDLMTPELIRKGKKTLIITSGRLVKEALKAVDETGLDIGVLNLRVINPINQQEILKIAKKYKYFIISEESVEQGSFTINIENLLRRNGYNKILTMNLPNIFIGHGSVNELLNKYSLDYNGFIEAITKTKVIK